MSRPHPPGSLTRLDARLVPRLAGAVRRFGRASRRLGAATGPPGRFVARAARRNPTITTAVVTVVAATTLILATGGDRHQAVAPAPPSAEVVLPGNQLGPTTGDQVSTYLAAAQDRRAELSVSRAQSITAVVDFKSYLTAAAVASVLAGEDQVQVTDAFARVAPPAQGDVHTIPLGSGSDLALALTRLSLAQHQTVVSYRKHVALAKRHPTPANQLIVTEYASIAKQAKTDAAGIGAALGCVFALEVTGPPSELQQLATRPDVRVLDPAPSTVATADLMIVPLEPQVVATVPQITFARD
jgi:hypothetical protein